MSRSQPTTKYRNHGFGVQVTKPIRRERTAFQIAVANRQAFSLEHGRTTNVKKCRRTERREHAKYAELAPVFTHRDLNDAGLPRTKDGNRLGLRKRIAAFWGAARILTPSSTAAYQGRVVGKDLGVSGGGCTGRITTG